MAVAPGSRFVNDVGTPSNPKYVEVVQRGSVLTTGGEVKPSLNVYHFRRKSTGATFDPTNVVAAIATAIEGTVVNAMNVRYTLTQWECRGMDDPSLATAIQPSGAVGQVTTDSYDSCSAVYFLIRTGYRGRSYKGSKHYTPLSEEDTVNDQLAGTGLTNWTAVKTMLAGLITGVTDTDTNVWYPIILSRELSSLDSNPAIFTGADWNEVLLNKTVGTMRRRKQKTVR